MDLATLLPEHPDLSVSSHTSPYNHPGACNLFRCSYFDALRKLLQFERLSTSPEHEILPLQPPPVLNSFSLSTADEVAPLIPSSLQISSFLDSFAYRLISALLPTLLPPLFFFSLTLGTFIILLTLPDSSQLV